LRKLLGFLLLCAIPIAASAQQWSGILDPSRAIDWSTAGVIGGIPLRTQICTTLSPGATAAQINSALSACPSGQTVFLNAGAYNLSAGIDFGGGKSNVTLRGAGADQTFLIFSNDAGCNGARTVVCMHSSDTNWKGGPSNLVNWTAGYAKGTTTITLASVPNLKVGYAIILDQTDSTQDDGSIVITATTGTLTAISPGITGPFSLEGNGGGDQRSGRQQQQIVVVTGCGGVTTPGASCSGTNVSVTISPGLAMPNWTGTKSPQAWWATDPSSAIGVENLSVDGTSAGSSDSNFEMFNCNGCWVKGVRGINSGRAQVQVQYSPRFTIRDSYFFLTQNSASQSYGFECYGGADGLVENNIFQAIAAPEMINGNCSGTVVAYNFSINNFYTVSSRYNASANNQHTAGIDNVLFEGNYGNAVYGDVFHGTHHFLTYFRNRWTGPQPACWQSGASYATAVFNTCTSNLTPVVLQSFSRFENFIGNVLGTTGTNTAYPGNIFDLGSGNSNGITTVPADPNVAPTLMRWGNCDSATGFGACRFVSGEVPSALPGTQAPFSNAVPGSQVLPASFYLSAKPSWWPAAKPWPGTGPDITGGNISGVGGRAFTIPAQDCAINIMGMPVDGTGSVRAFNAAACYVLTSAPAVSFSPSSLSFGNAIVGVTTSSQSVTLTNTGSATLTIASIARTGPNAADFTISANTCGGTLAAGANCAVSVTFTPPATGVRSAALTFTTNASSSPNDVPLSGTGVSAFAVSLSPTSLSYGSVGLGVTSSPQTVTLTNTGPATVTITSITRGGANPGDFAISANTCGASLGPGLNCAVSVTFIPTVLGARSATLIFLTNASSSPDSAALSGTGVTPPVPAVSLSPTSLSFGNIVIGATTAAQTVTLTNSGTATLTIASIARTGVNAADFAISANTCGGTLAAGLNCAVSVTFTPSATGVRSAALTFTTNAASSPNSAPLSGTGVPAFTVSLSPVSLPFGSVVVAGTSSAQTVTLTNTGPATVTITSITRTGANPGDFAISANTCGGTLAAGLNCTVSVTFTPTALGARSASLTFLTNASSSPDSASLSGTGVAAPTPAANLSPTTLSFGNVTISISLPSAAQTVTLTNSGSATLTITSISLTGPNAADFAIFTNSCLSTLLAGLNCAVSVTFTPLATGVRSAALTFLTNAASSPNSAALSGTGVTVPPGQAKRHGKKALLIL